MRLISKILAVMECAFLGGCGGILLALAIFRGLNLGGDGYAAGFLIAGVLGLGGLIVGLIAGAVWVRRTPLTRHCSFHNVRGIAVGVGVLLVLLAAAAYVMQYYGLGI
jgi:hypothetical protein